MNSLLPRAILRVTLPQLLRFCLVAFSLLALTLTVPSCGGDEAPKEKTEDLTELVDETSDVIRDLKRADKSKIFADDLAKAKKSLDDAEESIEEGKTKSAKRILKKIKRDIAKTLKSLKAVEAEMETVKTARRAADAAKKKAQVAKADVSAVREFEEATEAYDAAVANAKSTSAKKLRSAGKDFKLAADYFADAIVRAKENEGVRENIADAKADMLKLKALAKEKDAEKFAPQDWLSAARQERTAEKSLLDGNIQESLEQFRYAADGYASAATQANFISGDAEEPQLGRDYPPPPVGGVDPGIPPTELSEVDEVEPPDIDFDDPDIDFDDADINFDDPDELLANYASELSNGEVRYDPGTGKIIVTWTSGQQLRKDAFFPGGKQPPKKNLKWKDPVKAMQDVGTIPNPDGSSEPTASDGLEIPFVFHGNTLGRFLIPIPLTGKVSIDWAMQLEVMDVNGSMNVLIFADPKKGIKSMGTNFVTLFSRNGSGIKSPYTRALPKAFKRTPNGWFNKVKMMTPMRLALEDHAKNDEKRVLKVYYDLDENEEAVNRVNVSGKKSGYVGFEWSRVKFTVRALTIRGELVKDDAVKLLKTKLALEEKKNSDGDGGGDFDF